ncbi:triacylglycerol lipase OBL1-like [Phragmites australis]|uniref:triacylglycerol lipase OBL1-like n=1 Tax=Phragmites australis TaxID=29695 RepID=UPI002D781B98|nr:triacylglycerol lipase OBL1-like [Phragmites australis]
MVAQQLASGPKMGAEKLIIRSEKARFIDIMSLLLLRRPITSYPFVEAGDQTAADFGSTPGDWFVALTEVIQKALAAAYYPALFIGAAVEFLLNFIALNNGILGIIWNIFRCKLVIPLNREAPNYRSMIGMIDGRTELKPLPAGGGPDDRRLQVVGVSAGKATEEEFYVDVESGECGSAAVPLVQQQYVNGRLLRLRTYSVFEVTVMAAKLAYENAAYIENVVNNVWKFNFVGFYSCWNKFVGDHTTQAFVATDRASDASVVVVSFRGTEPFNMRDWSTDVNLSWLGMGAMGHVHIGFLKALGLQEEDGKDAARAFPKATPNAAAGKPVAYYKVREVLREQLKKHRKANVIVTGHSLGAALAAIFPALLAFHGERDILDRLLAVNTYGQPRVGDKTFAAYVRANLPVEPLRVVYRYDVVPRVPFDAPPVAEYMHGGTCVYFDGWYAGRAIAAGGDVPNPNYFDPRYLLSMYGNAWGDLFKGAFLWAKEGKDYREGAVSLLFRAAGLVIPGLASHSCRDYVNAVRLGRIAAKEA